VQFRPFWQVLEELGIDLPDPARIQKQEAGLTPLDNRRSQKDCWIPPGQIVEVAGYEIPGMVYCGEFLPSVNRASALEPTLIHPSLVVNYKKPDYAGKAFSSYSSYHQMTPANRAAYLEWLANGRRDPDIGTSYVMFFFHGLERRVFHDLAKVDLKKNPEKREELKQIAEEATQLRQHYRSGFGTNILHLIEACQLRLVEVEPLKIEPTTSNPLMLQIGLAQLIQKSQPLPADWAFTYCHQVARYPKSTSAQRFPEEFQALFRTRYAQKFGDGIVIKPKQSKLKVTYKPSSSSFANQSVTIQAGNLPDVLSLISQLSDAETVLDQCRKEFEPLVRLLGRNSELQNTPTAIALLPPELWHFSQNLTALQQKLERQFQQAKSSIVLFPGETLLKDWQSSNPDRLTPTETKAFLAFLEQCNYGIEPAVNSTSTALTNKSFVVLYQIQPGEITQNYEIAVLAVHIAIHIILTENASALVDQPKLNTQISSWISLSVTERIRVSAYVAWLSAQTPTLRNLKSRIEKIESEHRSTIAKFLIDVTATGSVSPKTVQLLEKAYTLLGLDAKSVYSDIHDRSTTSDDPVTVRKGAPLRGHKIPQDQRSLELDMSLIQSKIAESQEISGLLAEIFVDDQEPQSAPLTQSTIAGLDVAHSELLNTIAKQDVWQREELVAIADQLNLMLDGALEVLNEAAFDLCDEAVIEGDNTLEVNGAVLKELLE
jgi:hypothetical protein